MNLLFMFNAGIGTTSSFCIKIIGVLVSYRNIHGPEQEHDFIFSLMFWVTVNGSVPVLLSYLLDSGELMLREQLKRKHV